MDNTDRIKRLLFSIPTDRVDCNSHYANRPVATFYQINHETSKIIYWAIPRTSHRLLAHGFQAVDFNPAAYAYKGLYWKRLFRQAFEFHHVLIPIPQRSDANPYKATAGEKMTQKLV